MTVCPVLRARDHGVALHPDRDRMECPAERRHSPRFVENKKTLTGSDSSGRALLLGGMLTRTSSFAKGISARAGRMHRQHEAFSIESRSRSVRRDDAVVDLPRSIELLLKSGISEVGSWIGRIAEKPDSTRFHEPLFEHPVVHQLAGVPMLVAWQSKRPPPRVAAAAIGLTSSWGRPSWRGGLLGGSGCGLGGGLLRCFFLDCHRYHLVVQRHTCLSPTGMNRPVPAPIHTKSFNIWKRNFARNGLFFCRSDGISNGRSNEINITG